MSTASSPTSPNEHGVQELDSHFLITLNSKNEFCTHVDGRNFPNVQPVHCMRVDYEVWRRAPEHKVGGRFRSGLKIVGLQEVMRWWGGDVWLGRRHNDDVEMFAEGMKEEYTTLRHDLRTKGLTVRPFIPAPESPNKFPAPTYKAIMGTDATNENTLLARSLKSLTHVIATCESESGHKIAYGLLCSVPGGAKPALAIARVPRDLADAPTVTRGNWFGVATEIEVIGRIRDGVPRFDGGVGEEVVRAFFDSLGRIEGGEKVVLIDRVQELEGERRAEERGRKREAKKARRKGLSVSDAGMGVGSKGGAVVVVEEDEEVVKARQKAKAKEKRKAQKARKREMAESGKRVAQGVFELIEAQQKEDGEQKKDDEEEEAITYFRLANQTDDPSEQLYLWVANNREEDEKQEPEKLGLGGEESASSSDSGHVVESARGQTEVVVCKTKRKIDEAIQSRPSRRILRAGLDDMSGLGFEGVHL